jgi:hypothetical protein
MAPLLTDHVLTTVDRRGVKTALLSPALTLMIRNHANPARSQLRRQPVA